VKDKERGEESSCGSLRAFSRPAPAVWGKRLVGFCGLGPGDLYN
jgi:hypothetical protein